MSLGSSSFWRKLLVRKRDSVAERGEFKDSDVQGYEAAPSIVSATSKRTGRASIDISQPQSSDIPTVTNPKYEQGTPSIVQPASFLQQEPATISTTLPTVPASPTTSTETAPTAANLPERLWDRAYDDLKVEESTLVGGYERILSLSLDDNELDYVGESQKSDIEQEDLDTRRSQMKRLIDAGLKKTERGAKVMQGIGDAVKVVLSARHMISLAIETMPQAALAWTGVCFALQVSCCLETTTSHIDFFWRY
jgi:hypothetical protein